MKTQYTPTVTLARPANPGYRTRKGLTRIKRAVLGATLAGFLGVTMLAGLGSAGQAHAYEHVISYYEPDGTVYEIYKNDDGSYFGWIIEANGDNSVVDLDGNPNPHDDNPSSGPMTPEAIIELIKKLKGEGLEAEVDFWGTELGKLLIEKGAGLIPVYNPSDIGKGYDDGSGGGGTGFDPNGGDIGDQLGHGGTPGGQSSGGQDRGDHADDDFGTDSGDDMFDDVMVGPPELINPNPTLEGERITLTERVG